MASARSASGRKKPCRERLRLTVPWQSVCRGNGIPCRGADCPMRRCAPTREESGWSDRHQGQPQSPGQGPAGARSSRVRGSRHSASAVSRCSRFRHAVGASRTRRSAGPRTSPPRTRRLIVSNWPDYIDLAEKGDKNTLQDFEAATGITVDYTDDVSDNAEFFAKVRNQLGSLRADRPRHDDADRLDGGPDDRPRLDPAARRRQGAQPAQEPDQAAPGPPVGQGPHLLRPVAERPDRHRLQRQADQGGRELRRSCSPGSDLKGKITLLSEMRDTMAFMLKIDRRRPRQVHRRRVGQRHRQASRGREGRPGAGLHRQRVHPGPHRRQHRGLRGLVRRRDPAQATTPTSSSWCPRRGCRCGATTCSCPTRPSTRPTPRSGSTTTTSPRSRRSSRRTSTTSAPSRARGTRW